MIERERERERILEKEGKKKEKGWIGLGKSKKWCY